MKVNFRLAGEHACRVGVRGGDVIRGVPRIRAGDGPAVKIALRGRANAMTLIEVVAALALLATLLVTLLQTHAGAARQVVVAREKLAAVDAADALLADWWSNRAGIPINASGTTGPWGWRTSEITDAAANALHSRVVRIQLSSAQSIGPVVSIDVLQASHSPVAQP